MRICIFGAGASGGHFAVKLAEAGHDVSVLARGTQLEAIRTNGLTLHEGDRTRTVRVRAAEAPEALGAQDLVIVTVKAPALGEVAQRLPLLLRPGTRVVFAQNGMPWWYPHGLPLGRPVPPPLPVFRHAPAFLSLLAARDVLGGLIYSANEVVAPGVVRNASPGRNRLDVGAIEEEAGDSASSVREVLSAASLASPPVASIRAAVWRKLLVNLSGSAIALVTGNPSSIARDDTLLAAAYLRLVHEGLAICAAHGYPLDGVVDPDAMRAQLNDHKPSLLQDFERGRAMEVDEILLAPLAFAQAQDVPVPTLATLAAIARRLAADRGLCGPTPAGDPAPRVDMASP